ncbi:hypothetical protein CEQ90_18725 [Lewinellaceae bacterium SD302]|nr:hypothetical protein CEQ90_18725 [Lewinellaceae bacterium SD302]
MSILSAQQIEIPFNASAWEFNGADSEFVTYQNKPAIRINTGVGDAGKQIVMIKEHIFKNGTIDFYVAPDKDSRFTSIRFRQQDERNAEHVYLRSLWADNPKANSALQYAAIVDGINYWDLSHEYQSGADFSISKWNHVRLVIRDQQLLAYVNNLTTPALYIPIMDGNFESGSIGFEGKAWIAGLTITPNETPGLTAGKGYDPIYNDSRYLRDWMVGEPEDFAPGREPLPEDLPGENAPWNQITAERHGIVNLSRPFGATPAGQRRIVWLKTTITAKEIQRRRLDFGYSDEVFAYLDGKPLYQGKNLYFTPSMKAPRGRASIENASIDLNLQEGENELLIGVTNFFFGWGIVARLDDSVGLKY